MTIEEAVFELGQIDTEFIFTERQKEAYKKAIKALEEQQKHRWIPCSERLPEEEGEYLCWIWRFGRKSGRFLICKFTKDAYSFDKNDFDYYEGEKKALFYKYDSEYGFYEIDVVAWMPLPEPYKEVE